MAISKEEFGNRLRVIREQAARESANHISIELLCGGGYVSDVENGKHYPSMEKFMKLMDYYDMPYSTVFVNNSGFPVRIASYIGRLQSLDDKTLEIVSNMLDGILSNYEKQKK